MLVVAILGLCSSLLVWRILHLPALPSRETPYRLTISIPMDVLPVLPRGGRGILSSYPAHHNIFVSCEPFSCLFFLSADPFLTTKYNHCCCKRGSDSKPCGKERRLKR